MPVHLRYQEYVPDQTQFFDELVTEDWDAYKSEAWDATRRIEIERLFRLVQPKRIMDIGCGCGFHDSEMAKYPFVEHIDATDPSAESVKKAEQHYPHAKVRRWAAGFNDLPASIKYDLVVSFQVFEHLDCPNEYLAKCHEILADKGIAAIVMPNRLRLYNRIRVLKGLKPELIDVMHFREYTVRETAELASSHGFELFGSYGYNLDVGNFSHDTKLKLGTYFPALANGIGVLFKKS